MSINYSNIDVDESEDQVSSSALDINWLNVINLSGSPIFLKFYNALSADVTVGSTVPDLTFPVPSPGNTGGAGFTIAIRGGIHMSTALTVAATTGIAVSDSGAPSANALVVNLGYTLRI